MAIRIETGEGHLDLDEGCRIEIDLRSPLWNDLGSQSPVLTLPATARNLMLLSHPTRTDAAVRCDTVDGWLTDGAWRRAVRINIVSASENGIELSLGTDESLMYEAWQDTPLRDIPDLPLYTPQGEDEEERLDSLIAMCEEIYQREADDSDFRVFPVALEFKETEDDAPLEDTPRAVILNRLTENLQKKRPDAFHGTSLVSDERTIYVGTGSDETVLVPKGYGISPFLRVCRLLHILFESYGFTLEENVFDSDPQLQNLVLLNNTMDAIVRGKLDYRDLLPDCTINDLLESLRTRFGAVFYIDGSARTARCVLVRDTLAAEPDLDLTPLHQSRPRLTLNSPQHLTLSDGGSYDFGSTETDSYDGFLDRYLDYIDIARYSAGQSPLEFDRFTQSVQRYDYSSMRLSFFSSLNFPWKPQADDSEEYALSSKDKAVPLYRYRGRATETANPDLFNLAALPLFLSGVRNAHTSLKVSSSLQADETLDRDTDLAFCFAHGNYITDDYYDYGMNYGSPFCNRPGGGHFTTPEGHRYEYSLTFVGEDGCYNRFWKDFDMLLRHSGRTLETTLRLDRSRLSLLDLSRPKMLFGQKLLADTVQFSLPIDSATGRTSTFRTMRLLEPSAGTSPAYPEIRQITRPAGFWAYDTNLQQIEFAMLTSLRQWLEQQYTSAEITHISYVPEGRELLTDLKLPTPEQIASRETFSRTYLITCTIEYRYRQDGFFSWSYGNTFRRSSDTVTETWTATAYTD